MELPCKLFALKHCCLCRSEADSAILFSTASSGVHYTVVAHVRLHFYASVAIVHISATYVLIVVRSHDLGIVL